MQSLSSMKSDKEPPSDTVMLLNDDAESCTDEEETNDVNGSYKININPLETKSQRSRNTRNNFGQSFFIENITDKSRLRDSVLIERWSDAFEETEDFSQDTYTLMLFNPRRSIPYTIAIIVCIIQVTIFFFVIVELTDFENPQNRLGVPPDVSKAVRICQAFAIIITTFTQEDVRTGIVQITHGYESLRLFRAFSGQVTFPKYILSISCRLLMGFMGLLATMLLIITESSVLDLLLNFTAIEFVSQLDDLAFLLSANGYFGKHLKGITEVVSEAVYVKIGKAKVRALLFDNKTMMVFILSSMIFMWVVLVGHQSSGRLLCDTVYVQFGDEFLPVLGAFSGHYDRIGHSYEERRSREIQSIDNSGEAGTVKFTFCHKYSFWTFNIHKTTHLANDNKHTDPCEWLVRSEETTFSHLPLATGLRWFVRKGEAREGILQHISITCLDCENEDDVCGNKGRCNNENTCVCDDGWYGIRCDFPFPCPSMEIDTRFKKFLGAREFSSTYTLLRHDQSDNNQIVEVYDRPVYIDQSEDLGFDVIIFTGRRWILFHTREAQNTSQLAQLLSNNFHAYWSDWSKNSIIAFVSDPLDIGSPNDAVTPIGVIWHKAKREKVMSDNTYDKLAAASASIDVKLLCTACDNITSPCLFDGVCNADLQNSSIPPRCQCSLGSSGSLCQIPPLGDGKCDDFFNIPELSYDGGDCCEETCKSTSEYRCGEGVVGEESGMLAFGQIGYGKCIDPAVMSMISGSYTLFNIIERGYVTCMVRNKFGFAYDTADGEKVGLEVDLCKAVAAAVLNNPNAVKCISSLGTQRFKDLSTKSFDVIIRTTTVTSQRDIFEPTSETGFSFSSPYFFDGLKYGGIPPFSSCADNEDWTSPQCLDLKICVRKHTTWYEITRRLFPENVVVSVEGGQEVPFLNKGFCNAFAGESSSFLKEALQNQGLDGSDFEVGLNTFSKEPLAAVTRQDDRIWSKFVSWVIEALIQAEQFNITKATLKNNSLAPTVLFGSEFTNMFHNAIAVNGNYGELYEKNMERYIPRGTGLNNINKGNTALIYSFPFGSTDVRGSDPISDGTIERILKRGTLNCGVRSGVMGFATEDPMTMKWSGFHVDICNGIAAALFNGAVMVRIYSVTPSSWFSMLQNGVVDILVAGVSHTLTREIKEPSTGKGFDFSPTYFYDGMRFAGPTPYGICADRLIFDNTTFDPDCHKTKICVPDSTTWLDTMKNSLQIPDANILVVEGMDVMYDMLASGKCNAIVGESVDVAEISVRKRNYPPDADYYIGGNKHTLERLAIVSRSDDAQFSDFIRWLVFALFYAAEENIKQERYYYMPGNVLLLGDNFSGMLQNMIKAAGNYNELFERNLNGIVNRDGANLLNLHGGSQLFANVGVTKGN